MSDRTGRQTGAHSSTLSPEHFARLRAIFESALEQHPSERRAFVEGACVGDQALLREVLGMLAAEAGDPSLFDRVATTASSSNAPDEGRFAEGTVIAGRYRLVRVLGRGGMDI